MANTILLIDDDDAFRKEFIECFSEHNVIEASTGEEALRILKKPNDIDLVFLDVMMPGQLGTDTLKEIRKYSPDLNIVILTGCSTELIAIESLRSRANDYLTKPINVEKTRNLIERMMSKKEPNVDELDMKSKIERVKKFIEKNASKNVSLKDAADLLFLSPKYLSKVFKETEGTSFIKFKTNIKLDMAKALLKGTACNVSQIADKLGYNNIETFIRQFKKSAGLSPLRYRNSRNKQKDRE